MADPNVTVNITLDQADGNPLPCVTTITLEGSLIHHWDAEGKVVGTYLAPRGQGDAPVDLLKLFADLSRLRHGRSGYLRLTIDLDPR